MGLGKLSCLFSACVFLCAGQVSAINVTIDYRYDSGNFFGAGNPSGAAAGQLARDALEAAADYYSDVLTDTFTGISTPPDYVSQVFDGIVTYEWSAGFNNPDTGLFTIITDETIQPDEYLIFAGARPLGGNTAGVGGVGTEGFDVGSSGFFTQAEADEANAISDQFISDVTTRGETSGFVSWGGSIAFDSDGSSNWWYNHTTPTGAGTVDFYSVALHELAHALGFGSDEWEAMVAGSAGNYYFTGSASNSLYGGLTPVDNDKSHWADGVSSTVYGGTASQGALMDPGIGDGERDLFTTLDAAGMTDIGWDVTPPVLSLTGDLDGDGFVGIADLNIVLGNWNQFVTVGSLPDGDPSGDGYVGIEDLNQVLGNWNAGTPPTQPSVIPEPAAALLLGLMLPTAVRRR